MINGYARYVKRVRKDVLWDLVTDGKIILKYTVKEIQPEDTDSICLNREGDQ
jgi:hypothetical protein